MPEKFPIKQISRILKTKIGRVFLSLLVALSFLISVLVIHSINSQSSSPTKSCNDSSITSPQFTADKNNNCLVYLNGLSNGNGSTAEGIALPACISDSDSSYRVNCADPINFPLCNSIGENNELRNCVKECEPSQLDEHNISCIKFCDSSQKDNCVDRKCHQPKEILSANGSPTGTFEDSIACERISCNLLTEGELSLIAKICNIYDLYKNPPTDISKLSEDQKINLAKSGSCFQKYCKIEDSIGQKLRCYQYSAKQLPVTKILNCDLHSCNYTNPNNASETISEFSNIINKNSGYKPLYCKNVQDINNESCSDDSLSNLNATTKYCKSAKVLKFSYSCMKLNEDEVIPSVKNNECNTTCVQGSCFKEVICDSKSTNRLCYPPVKEYEPVNTSIEQKIGSQDLLSIFNRPTPPPSSYNGTHMKAINEKYRGGDAANGAISSDFIFKCIDEKGVESPATLGKCTESSPKNNFNESKDSKGNCCLNGQKVKIDPINDFTSRGSILNLGQTDICGTYYQQLGNGSYSPPYYPTNRYGSSYHNVGTGRGVGYIYLCGNDGLLYNKVSEQTAYFKGYPQEVWSSDDVSGKRKIKVTVCLRYRNAFYPWGEDTCGARSCVRSCHFFKDTEEDLPCFEYCGEDVCKELEIDESDPKKCSMSDGFLAENTNECSQLMDSSGLADGYLRLRAVSYGDKVCAFLDVKGQLAYDDSIFIRPHDKIPMTQREMEMICKGQDPDKCRRANEDCITGYNDGYGNCIGAFDTAADGKKGLAHVFRPMLRVQYTGSLFGANKKEIGLTNAVPGYYDVSGRFVEQMPCAPIELRIAPPSQFNLANYQNSSKIFEPPLFISGFTSSINNSKAVDFFEPELQVTYGNTNLKLKLSKGVKQGVVIDANQLQDIQQKNKSCSYDDPNEVRLFAIKSFAELGSNINCNDSKLNKPEYYKYVIDDISPFINQSYKNQYGNFEIKDNSGGKIMSYSPSENEQLGKLTRNTYSKSVDTFNLTSNQAEDIRLQKSITLQTVFNQSTVKRVVVFLKRNESFNDPQICLMRREFFVLDSQSSGSSYQIKDYEVSCVKIDKTQLNLVAYGKINKDDEKVDLGKYVVNGADVIDEIGKIYANKRIYYRYAVSKSFNSSYNSLPNVNYYGDEYYLSSPKSNNNSSCEVNSSLNLEEDEENILLGSDKYILCAQRSYCSSIYNECIASYIQKNRKEILGQDSSVEKQSINYCKSLEDNCNSLMHFSDSNFPSPYSSDSYKLYSRDKQYSGWFNEICLTKNGLEHLFSRKVVVYNKSGIQSQNSDSACVAKLSSCNSGDCSCSDADGIKCLCVEADLDESGKSVLPNQYKDVLKYDLREKNSHEAGLCVNMPILKSCPAINYKTDQERADASAVGNAEFDVSFPSMKKIKGECRGNWRTDPDPSKAVYGDCKMKDVTGNDIEAESSSIEIYNSANNKVSFSKNNGSCIRYSCPEITAGKFSKPYPDIFTDILFPENSYAIYNPKFQATDEIGDDVGKKLGFSNWQAYLKTKDGNEDVASSYNATISYYNNSGEAYKIYSCIPGYKVLNATPDRSEDYMSIKDLSLLNNIAYKKVIGYSYVANNVPKRQCNDNGNWVGDVANACEPIKCPAIKPNSPLEIGISINEMKKRIAEWSHINGAEFTESLASRSLEYGRVIYGSCNAEIGYQVMPGGKPPSRECDYLGNWGPIKNPCSGKCDAINAEIGNDINNGYSEWLKVENVGNNQVKIISASKCIEGFYKYPYSANRIFAKTNTFNLTINDQYIASTLFDDFGDATIELKDRESSTASATESVNNSGLPIRGCFNSSNEFSKFNSTSSARWLAPLSICTNSCPSGDLDARIGIGVTEHDSSIGKVRIIWPSTNFGEEAVAYGKVNDYIVRNGVKYLNASFSKSQLSSSQSIADYIGSDRTNGNYVVIRGCGNISAGMAGKWVSLNNGCASTSSGSTQRTFSSSDNGVLVNESRSYIATGLNLSGVSCNGSQNYYKANKNTSSAPSYQCVNIGSGNIDKTYYSRVSGTSACSQYCLLNANQNINGLQSNNSTAIYLNANETQSATCKGCGSSNNIICNSSYQLNSTGDCHVCRDCTAGNADISGSWTTTQNPDCSTRTNDVYGYTTTWCEEGGDEATFSFYNEVLNASVSHGLAISLPTKSETSCPLGGRYCGCNTKCPDIFATGSVSCNDGKKTVNTWSWISWRYVN